MEWFTLFTSDSVYGHEARDCESVEQCEERFARHRQNVPVGERISVIIMKLHDAKSPEIIRTGNVEGTGE